MNRISTLIIIIFSISALALAQDKERSEIPDKYKWDLSDLFKNNDEFKTGLKKIEARIPEISKYKGKLADKSDYLFQTLDSYYDISKELARLQVYAYRLADEDVRVGDNQSLKQLAQGTVTKFAEASSYIQPEILAIGKSKVESFLKNDKNLKEFKFSLEDLFRTSKHTLTASEEEILASAGGMARTPVDVFNVFNNGDRTPPKVTLSDGKEIEISSAGYSRYRAVSNREDRAKIFKAQFEGYKKYENTFGANLAGKVRGDWFFAKSRKYGSTLESELNEYNIPVSVYKNLIKQIHDNLPTLHRALELKKKMLGVDELHYYDLYVPLVDAVEMPFTVEEAQETTLKALKPLGDDYLKVLKKAYTERWIDYYPSKGKRSGAYSSGSAYDVHPYILHNFNDDYEGTSTLAHEVGHSLHSYLTNKNQPYQYTDYSTFIAEIASTTNENLLNDYMIANAKTDEEKLYLLGSVLELLRQTIFRQVSFAEFEMIIHEKIENGEPLTGEKMSDIYFGIVKKYYGHDEGICVVDDYVRYEWAYIPHFLIYTYYVYQYSTSLIYSTAFAEKIQKEGAPAVEKYLKLLEGGSSDYPIELIRKAGIDPLSSEAFDLTMSKMNKVIDQIEKIVSKK